jgi:hypothetical protein
MQQADSLATNLSLQTRISELIVPLLGPFLTIEHRNPIDWKKSLVGGFSTEDGSVKVSATCVMLCFSMLGTELSGRFGHLIFTSPSQTHRTLTPPLTGSHVLRKITTWSAETPSRPDFLPRYAYSYC